MLFLKCLRRHIVKRGKNKPFLWAIYYFRLCGSAGIDMKMWNGSLDAWQGVAVWGPKVLPRLANTFKEILIDESLYFFVWSGAGLQILKCRVNHGWQKSMEADDKRQCKTWTFHFFHKQRCGLTLHTSGSEADLHLLQGPTESQAAPHDLLNRCKWHFWTHNSSASARVRERRAIRITRTANGATKIQCISS